MLHLLHLLNLSHLYEIIIFKMKLFQGDKQRNINSNLYSLSLCWYTVINHKKLYATNIIFSFEKLYLCLHFLDRLALSIKKKKKKVKRKFMWIISNVELAIRSFMTVLEKWIVRFEKHCSKIHILAKKIKNIFLFIPIFIKYVFFF